jgi:hypothetical protein
MSNIEVFLKCNRETLPSLICLDFWIKVFSDYKVTIICDLFDVTNSNPSSELKKVARHIPIINTDYSLSKPFGHLLKVERWHNVCSSNLTCFKANTSNNFWLIDADDTQFLTTNIGMIKEKVKRAEDYLIDGNLDGLSLDFYREHNDTWTFGVCLLDAKINCKKISEVRVQVLEELDLALNGDSIFDILGRKGVYKLKSFVFDEFAFQHVINNFPKLAAGIYWWKDRKLWDKPLKEDVISL